MTSKKFKKVMHEWGEGKLHSGSKKGPKVKSQKQALAIAFSEAGEGRKKALKKKMHKQVKRMHEYAKDR